MDFTITELGQLCEACAKRASAVRRMSTSPVYDPETAANLAQKADELEALRERFARELKAANEGLAAAVEKLAGHRCHWCKQWINRGASHSCTGGVQ